MILFVPKIKKWAGKGRTVKEIATSLQLIDDGVTCHTVRQLMIANNISRTGGKAQRRIKNNAHRYVDMKNMYESGEILECIGAKYSITRERVRQILKEYFGFDAKNGGQHVAASQRRDDIAKKHSTEIYKNKGCTFNQYKELRDLKTPPRVYAAQRRNAGVRGISWDFDLWSWWQVWEASGKWAQRGKKTGQYVMARYNDTGPYSTDNVKIITCNENIREYWARQ